MYYILDALHSGKTVVANQMKADIMDPSVIPGKICSLSNSPFFA